MNAWRPISTAPKDGAHVLVYDHAGAEVLEAYFFDDDHDSGWYRANLGPSDEDSALMEPRAWMPIPDPPSPEAQAADTKE